MNKVILMGRLTRDPEVRYTQTNNTLVASFSLAVNRRFVRQGEERQADFINCVAWRNQAENLAKYIKKGSFDETEGIPVLDTLGFSFSEKLRSNFCGFFLADRGNVICLRA